MGLRLEYLWANRESESLSKRRRMAEEEVGGREEKRVCLAAWMENHQSWTEQESRSPSCQAFGSSQSWLCESCSTTVARVDEW